MEIGTMILYQDDWLIFTKSDVFFTSCYNGYRDIHGGYDWGKDSSSRIIIGPFISAEEMRHYQMLYPEKGFTDCLEKVYFDFLKEV